MRVYFYDLYRLEIAGLAPESLIGHVVKVYWPLDSQFYQGRVVSFNPATYKHKVGV